MEIYFVGLAGKKLMILCLKKIGIFWSHLSLVKAHLLY